MPQAREEYQRSEQLMQRTGTKLEWIRTLCDWSTSELKSNEVARAAELLAKAESIGAGCALPADSTTAMKIEALRNKIHPN